MTLFAFILAMRTDAGTIILPRVIVGSTLLATVFDLAFCWAINTVAGGVRPKTQSFESKFKRDFYFLNGIQIKTEVVVVVAVVIIIAVVVALSSCCCYSG